MADEFELPPNTTTEAWLPGATLTAARVNNTSIHQTHAASVLSVKEQDGGLLLKFGSGMYRVVVSK